MTRHVTVNLKRCITLSAVSRPPFNWRLLANEIRLPFLSIDTVGIIRKYMRIAVALLNPWWTELNASTSRPSVIHPSPNGVIDPFRRSRSFCRSRGGKENWNGADSVLLETIAKNFEIPPIEISLMLGAGHFSFFYLRIHLQFKWLQETIMKLELYMNGLLLKRHV